MSVDVNHYYILVV